jgi:HTH-type transcriptional regulator/antitoxin HigA
MTEFKPDWVSPPGDTISDAMEERGWGVVRLAGEISMSPNRTRMLLSGELEITPPIARNLALVCGGSVGFWLNREAQYRRRVLEFSHDLWVGAREHAKRYAKWKSFHDEEC